MTESRFSDESASVAWNEGADAWQKFVESGADYYRTEVHGPALLAACGAVRGQNVLDLGCGQGYFTRQLAAAGASVVGIDLSDRLLAFARADEQRRPLGVEYYHLAAREVDQRWPPESFDLVTACMSVQDMADPDAAIRSASAVLRRDGRLVFSVPHLCTDTPHREWERNTGGQKLALKIDRYFESGPATCDWNMPRLLYSWRTPYWRRTLTEWSELIRHAGLIIEYLQEPRPSPEQTRARPDLEDLLTGSLFLIFVLRRCLLSA